MASPLFILSFRHRDELSQLAQQAGWQPIAARRGADVESRFVASGAAVAVVDARGALDEGREAVRAIAGMVEANACALLVLVSRTDIAALDGLFQLGATHFLASPFTDQQLLQSFQFALRHAERAGAGPRGHRRSLGEEAASWRWTPGSRKVELSPALARQVGVAVDDERKVGLMDLFRKMGPDGRRAARDAVEKAVSTGSGAAFAHTDGGRGRLAHHVQVQEAGEITGRTETLRSGAGTGTRDPLTGLRDGRAARAWLAERLGGDQMPIVLLLSVSRYDVINAAFGRSTGDAVLQAVARRIERMAQADGRKRQVARLAGAEFAVLLAPPATLAEAQLLAGRIVEAIAKPFMSGDQPITLGSRVGIASAKPDDDAQGLLRRASAALAEAKRLEGAPVQVLDDNLDDLAAHGDRLEVDLRRALSDDEIDIKFQPQVSVITGKVVGVEALARWNHPELGELGAVTLFAVAERSDYLTQLSDHVQRKAIATAAAWPEALKSLRLSVNITSADILRPGFAAIFTAMVLDSGFNPMRLTVEVTESGLIEDLSAAANLLADLRASGLRVAIDDFGTGYSSLAYLKALPLDYLKIDKRLSEDITGSSRDRVVVRSVIDMARSLGLEVIAEGVETDDQLGLLAQEGCNLYQGFLCAPPVSVDELVQLTG